MYGVGFVIAAWSGLLLAFPARQVLLWTGGTVATLSVVLLLLLPTAKAILPIPNLRLAGVQLEFPDAGELIQALDRVVSEDQRLVANHQGARPLTPAGLVVLPEHARRRTDACAQGLVSRAPKVFDCRRKGPRAGE